MNIKKTVKALLIINGLQFVAAFLLWLVIGSQVLGRVNPAIYLTIGIMLLSSLLTIMGLYMASRYQNDSYRESMKNLENLNLKLRAQRHDYMNHLQVIYGLLELGEYEDAREYMEPVFKDITRVTRAMKTSQPAVNALLQAKMESAEKKGVDMIVEVGTPLKEIPLEPWELCKLLANLIDNGITALEEKEGEKSWRWKSARTADSIPLPSATTAPLFLKSIRLSYLSRGFPPKKKKATVPDLLLFPRSLRKPKEKSAFPPMKRRPALRSACPGKYFFYLHPVFHVTGAVSVHAFENWILTLQPPFCISCRIPLS